MAFYKSLSSLVRSLAADPPLPFFLQSVLEEARRLTASPLGYAGYLEPEGERAAVFAFTGPLDCAGGRIRPAPMVKRLSRPCKLKLKGNQPLVHNQVTQSNQELGLPDNHPRLERFMAVTSVANGLPRGLVVLANSPRPYQEQDIAFAECLAGLASLALQRHPEPDQPGPAPPPAAGPGQGPDPQDHLLLSEAQHRLRNSLQLISSLLSLHASQASDPATRRSFSDCQNRLQAMLMLHESLHRTRLYSQVDLQHYLSLLCERLKDVHALASRRIAIQVQAQGVLLDADRAMPCGLAINELVTNSLKHAFGSAQNGLIQVRAIMLPTGAVELEVSDNGQGLSRPGGAVPAPGLGLQLVRGLVETQLQGKLDFNSGPGAKVRIMLPPRPSV